MHYLEKEFQRLIKYAQGLGIKVSFVKDPNMNMAAAWLTDGSEIIVYNRHTKGPLQLCLMFIHELSHHICWIHGGKKVDLKTDNILKKEDEGKVLTKKQRKVIYDMEVHDSQFQKTIHKEIQSRIPIKRLELEIEFDLWIYEYFYKQGKYPNKKQRIIKFKELRSKYV